MAPPIEVIVVEKVDPLGFLLNFLFTSFDAPKAWSFDFRKIGMGGIIKTPSFLYHDGN